MIACRIEHLEARCRERGYTLAEVRACIVAEDGDSITVDETHPSYPRQMKPGFIVLDTGKGPGTELKKLLARIGINATPDCKCNARAVFLDSMENHEPGWCEAHIDEVVGWLREEATKRGLPFLDAAGRMLVKRAIQNARKATIR